MDSKEGALPSARSGALRVEPAAQSQAEPPAANAWFVEVEHEDNIDHDGDPEVYVCDRQTVCTATVVATIGTHTGLSLAEKVSTAHKIAAALDMLAELKSIVRIGEVDALDIIRIEALIAKAEAK